MGKIKMNKFLKKDSKSEAKNKSMGLDINIYNNLVKVPTLIAKNRTEEEFLYQAMLEMGFEGTIVRNMDGIYKADPNTKSSYLRSMDVQKRKQLFCIFCARHITNEKHTDTKKKETIKYKKRGLHIYFPKLHVNIQFFSILQYIAKRWDLNLQYISV